MPECKHPRFTIVGVENLGTAVVIYVDCDDCEGCGKRTIHASRFANDYTWESFSE